MLLKIIFVQLLNGVADLFMKALSSPSQDGVINSMPLTLRDRFFMVSSKILIIQEI